VDPQKLLVRRGRGDRLVGLGDAAVADRHLNDSDQQPRRDGRRLCGPVRRDPLLPAQPNGRYTIVDPPDSFPNEELADINNRGEIVGFADEDGDNRAGTRGFLRTRRGRYVAIEVPGAGSTVPFKANDRGQVVGL
jgi:hypothetical protein